MLPLRRSLDLGQFEVYTAIICNRLVAPRELFDQPQNSRGLGRVIHMFATELPTLTIGRMTNKHHI